MQFWNLCEKVYLKPEEREGVEVKGVVVRDYIVMKGGYKILLLCMFPGSTHLSFW
jgi:hypothetical protein